MKEILKLSKYFIPIAGPLAFLGGIFLVSVGIIWGWILITPVVLWIFYLMWRQLKQLLGLKTCPHCNGTGVKEYCPYCEGKGRIKKEK